MFTNAMRKNKSQAKGIRQRNSFGRMEQLETRDLLSVTINRTTENFRFTIDTTSSDKSYVEYQAFKVTNDSATETLTNLWVKATNFPSTQKVQLAPNEDGLYYIGTLAPHQSDTAFFYLQATDFSDVTPDPQTYTIEVWNHAPPLPNPSIPGDTWIASKDFEFLWVAEAHETDDGAVTDSVSVSYWYGGLPVAMPVVGGEMKIQVTGELKKNADRVLFMPATSLYWPADTFELRSTDVSIDGVPLGEDIIWQRFVDREKRNFDAKYTFAINGTTGSTTPVTPREYTAEGDVEQNRKFDHSRLLKGVVPIPVVEEATDLEITKTGPTVAVAGSSTIYTYEIKVTATGAFASQGVFVTDQWPTLFTHVSYSDPGAIAPIGDHGDFKWTIGTLAAGTSRSLIVSFTVPGSTPSADYVNTATVTSTTPDPGPNTASVTTAVVGVSIQKTADTGTVVAGSSTPGSFSITVQNTSSTVDLSNVVVSDVWPWPLSTIVSFSQPVVQDPADPRFTWTLDLGKSSSKTLTVTYKLPKTTTLGKYTNRSTVTSIGGAPVSLPASADVTVVNVPLTIAKTVDAAVVKAGTNNHYFEITVSNASAFLAENVQVSDIWPTGLIRGASSDPLAVTPPPSVGGNFVWDIGTISGGGSKTLRVYFDVPSNAALKLYTNRATVSSNTQVGGSTAEISVRVVAGDTRGGIVLCTDDGCDPAWVRVLDANGNLQKEFQPYGAVRGGLRVATGDVNADGVDEIIVGPGLGVVGPVKVFNQNGTPLSGFVPFYPYGTGWRSGVEVASAYIDGDGRSDIITGMSLGIGTVNIYLMSNGSPSLFRSFRGAPAGYAGGVTIAAADFGSSSIINGKWTNTLDGKAEVVVGTNAGITAQVRIFDVQPTVPQVVRTIIPFGTAFKGGVSLSIGNYDADPANTAEIIVGAGIGGQSVVKVFNGQTGATVATMNAFSTFAKPNAVVNVALLNIENGVNAGTYLYGVQGRGGTGGTVGVSRAKAGTSSRTPVTTVYAPPMRIAAINLPTTLLSRSAGLRVRP